MQSVIQITLDWLIEHKVFACITRLRNFKSILGPVPLGWQNNFRFWSPRVCGLYKLQPLCPSTHHLLLLSLPLLLNLLPKFVQLILSGEERLKTQRCTLKMFQSPTNWRFQSISCAYLHEFVVLEYGCGVEYQLAVFNVIFESSHIGFTEGHKFLKWGRAGLHINHQHLKCSRDSNSANKTVLFTHLLTRQCLGRFCYFCIALCTLNICKHTTPHVKNNMPHTIFITILWLVTFERRCMLSYILLHLNI